MEQQKRMVGTLACLVVSMTGTAALLGWIDPSKSTMAVTLSATDTTFGYVNPVKDVDFRRERWDEVDVVLLEQSDGKGNDGAIAHLYVDEVGDVDYDPLWLEQLSIDGHPRAIRIAVQLHPSDSVMNQQQQSTVSAILAAINSSKSDRGQSIPAELAN